MFVLERLSDDDIRKIVVQAVERVSETAPPKDTALPPSSPVSAVEIEILDDDDDPKDVASSQPDIEEPLAQPSSSTQVSTQASASSGQTDVTDASGEGVTPVQFPAYPHFTPKVLSTIVALSTGDARTALSLTELVLNAAPADPVPGPDTDAREGRLLAALRRSVATAYDRTGDSHYDLISALHKSVRGSQGSAALYWLARMLTAGEDPLYVARRMVVCASEDVGLADPHALPLVRFSCPLSLLPLPLPLWKC